MTDALTDIKPELLKQRGIRLLMLDFDNTIVPYTTSVPAERMDRWLRDMLKTDITVCVVSNSRKARVQVFCKKYGMPCITHARKPFSKGIRLVRQVLSRRIRRWGRFKVHGMDSRRQ